MEKLRFTTETPHYSHKGNYNHLWLFHEWHYPEFICEPISKEEAAHRTEFRRRFPPPVRIWLVSKDKATGQPKGTIISGAFPSMEEARTAVTQGFSAIDSAELRKAVRRFRKTGQIEALSA